MNKYQTQAKIYAIRSYQTEEIYIGSTCDTLSKRFYSHKIKFKQFQNGKANYITSFKMLEYADAYIELLENCPCNDKNELTRREGELIRVNAYCVNKNIAGRTIKQYYQDNAEVIKAKTKQYYQANIEHIKDYHKQYQQVNVEKIKEQTKQYYQANAEKIKERTKQYRQDNADKIKQKHDCPCGGKYTTSGKSTHLKTKKHQKYLETV